MTISQITIRLTEATKVEFNAYAARLGLKASELTKLLIARERNLRRLAILKGTANASSRQRRQDCPEDRLPTVTAHLSTRAEVNEFDAYARSCDLNRSGAGRWLLEMELHEKWLERALSMP